MKNLQRADEYRRYRAVELMERGEPKDLISRILGVSLVTRLVCISEDGFDARRVEVDRGCRGILRDAEPHG